jgi:tripartite-type tricarboxylate transporter receptor subunit TctC
MLPAVSRAAWAQGYPTRPVRWIVPFPPGGGTDIVARLIGQWLSERSANHSLSRTGPGAGTNIGTESVVRAPPDGYTLLLVASVNAINATLYDKLSFNFIRDVAPVASIMRQPLIMLVNPSLAVKTVPEFIAYAKANPGKINMASPAMGPRNTSPASLLRSWPVSTWFMCLIGVRRPRLPICSAGRCRSISPPRPID